MNRKLLLGAGLAALALAWAPQTSALIGHGFTGHMIRHMGVVAIAAPLLALSVAGSRYDLSDRHPLLFAAVPASLVELIVVWGWHTPAAHDLARGSDLAYLGEQASFLLSGLWVWLACFGYGAATKAGRTAAGVVAMLLTSIHMTLLGALLAMSVRPLYAAHHQASEALTLLNPLDDQQLGGVMMLLIGGAAYLAGGVALVGRLLSDDRAPSALTRGGRP
ncbi:putative membrane protein [Methylopila capsulata]|uniref:Membrane protein n=1 Tax=Methylopila capsulata TaxID=61654 RepID=A0A9W6IUE0_9HYPH|nr:cytochrome c oxidase assembly protein [Methylopila capsulata]MBM7852172.1 putative membrane protein [Methylopila capsulata]GLK56378.1 hypothetical protein GCM10008170_23970 [Methylopila capsulata]